MSQYQTNIDAIWGQWKAGQITLEDRDAQIGAEYCDFMAREHLRDNDNCDIFCHVVNQTKKRYAALKDDYYQGNLTKAEYLTQRESDEGTGYFDKTLYDYGLSTQRWPDDEREYWLVKSLLAERAQAPESLIPIGIPCPTEIYMAACDTTRVFLESVDDYISKYVPTTDIQIRDKGWCENDEERAGMDMGYISIEVTDSDRAQYRSWRDA